MTIARKTRKTSFIISTDIDIALAVHSKGMGFTLVSPFRVPARPKLSAFRALLDGEKVSPSTSRDVAVALGIDGDGGGKIIGIEKILQIIITDIP